MIKLIAITLVVGLFLVGCTIPNVSPTEDVLPPVTPPEQKVEQPTKEQPPKVITEEPCADCPEEPVDKQGTYTLKATPAKPKEETEVVLPGQPPDDMTWISPGKVQVGNFYPGARAEWLLIIHNGNDTETSFSVKYRYPDHVGEEYWHPPEAAQDWVIIADTTPVLMPRETREILIVLEMPEDAEVFAPKWEFWISVIDTSQTGMVRTELCTRWLIDMRS